MRPRPLMLAAAGLALALSVPAHAATRTLDGKKTKALSFTDKVTSAQDNDKDFVTSSSDRTFCSPPRCAKFSFVYKPAKGVRAGAISAKITWTVPGQDYDLYLAEARGGEVASCGASAGQSEIVTFSNPKPGRTYLLVIDHYRTVPDTVKATVSFPAKDKVPTTVPSQADGKVLFVNCGL